MKSRILTACALAVCVCGLASSGAWASAAAQEKQQEVKVSGGERDAATKINKAKGAEAKLQAASEFLKKYPQSSLRPQVAQAVAGEILSTQDNQLKISLAEAYLSIFNTPAEAEHVNRHLLNAYIDAEKAEDAFRIAGPWLEKHPDDVDSMRRLAVVAVNESIRGNNNFIDKGQQYGSKAIELIEADRKPASIDAAQWADYKTRFLPDLYRQMGVLAMSAGDKAATKARLEKAAALKSTDPAVYFILGDIANDEYTFQARKFQAMPAGAEKQAQLKKAEEELDKVIELYAQAIAMAEGNQQYQQYQQAAAARRQELENYYKFRHNNSTDGLQQLIDKYKRQ